MPCTIASASPVTSCEYVTGNGRFVRPSGHVVCPRTVRMLVTTWCEYVTGNGRYESTSSKFVRSSREVSIHERSDSPNQGSET
eukprot:1659830-Prymnesium_polylepis.1